MKVYGYSRESTWDQENGLEVQLEQIHNYRSSRMPDAELGGIFTDRAVSGSKPFRKREAGAKLDALLVAGDHVIVSKLDRGFRDTLDFLATERDWRDRGIKLHILDLPFFGDDVPEYISDMIRTVLAMFAQFERARIRQRTKDVVRWMKSQGLRYCFGAHCHGIGGLGYYWTRKGSKKVLLPHEGEQAMMKWLFEERQKGRTWEDLYFQLLLDRVRTRHGREWSLTRIKRSVPAWEKILQARQEPGALPEAKTQQIGAPGQI